MLPEAPTIRRPGSLREVREALRAPVHRRTPMWVLVLAAGLAAVAGVSTAGVMILGPGGDVPTTRTAPLR